MSSREDIIEIPIEIKTSDLDELNRLIQELHEAKGKIETTRSARKIQTGGAGAPIKRDDPEILSIFRSDPDRDTLPLKSRDVKSRQAIQRGDSFHELASRVDSLENVTSEATSLTFNALATLGINVPYLQSAVKGINIGKGLIKKSSSINKAPVHISPVKSAGLAGGLIKIGKAIPYIGGAIFAAEGVYEIISSIADKLFGVGGVWDRRFRLIIKDEMAGEASRQEKAAIAQGFRTIITTSSPTLRGSTGISSTLEKARFNQPLYSNEMEYKVRNG